MYVREKDREGLPWVYETAKTRICDIADRWKDANLHFGVSLQESHSNDVKWQWEGSV